jgi:hypothetical protein
MRAGVDLANLPMAGALEDVGRTVREMLDRAFEQMKITNFYEHSAEFRSINTKINSDATEVAKQILPQLGMDKQRIYESFTQMPQWPLLSADVHRAVEDALRRVQLPDLATAPGLSGLRAIVNQQFALNAVAAEQRRYVEQKARELQPAAPADAAPPDVLRMPAHVRNVAELDALIARLTALRSALGERGVALKVEE